jgi:hypothetical protein
VAGVGGMLRRTRTGTTQLALAVALLLALAPVASADHQTRKKGIWGPLDLKGRSAFPLYHKLGVGVYEMYLNWRDTAVARPANARNPRDPAYRWPPEIDTAVARAGRHGIAVSLLVMWTPAWANGGREGRWAPDSVKDLADFMTAASRRYPRVRRWMVWGEPTRDPNFMPLVHQTSGAPLTAEQARGPRKYARMLDASYGALKRVSRRNLVIGGNSYTTGDISPLNWIRSMRLPSGRRPRMDMYGHNAFTLRRPDLSQPIISAPDGYADFSDLDTLFEWLDSHGYRDARGKPLRVFISEWLLPTDHSSHEFNFYVTRELQARWLADALRIVQRTRRIATLGWLSLLDEPPRPDGLEVNRGLMTHDGRRKPAFHAFKNG